MTKTFAETVTSLMKIVPYKAGRTQSQICRELGISNALKMSSNENPLGTSSAVLNALSNPRNMDIHRYPDAGAVDLREALATHLEIDADSIVCGNGSNDILAMCATLALRPGKISVYSEHSYICYRLFTEVRCANAIEVPSTIEYEHDLKVEYGHDLKEMAAACANPAVSVVYVANPNNPTGSWHDPKKIHAFLCSVPSRVLAVLDEAYLEYVEHGRGESVGWIGEFPNLVICRTFSKIYGLAGLRIGYAITGEQMCSLLNRVRPPFNANTPAQRAALAALGDSKFVATSRRTNDEGKTQLYDGFLKMGIKTMSSQGNFITFKPATSRRDRFEKLVEFGVILRSLEDYGLDGWLRTTVGTEDQNEKILAAVARLQQ